MLLLRYCTVNNAIDHELGILASSRQSWSDLAEKYLSVGSVDLVRVVGEHNELVPFIQGIGFQRLLPEGISAKVDIVARERTTDTEG